MSTILIKRSQVTATPPSLTEGELAYSELSDTLFIGIAGSVVSAIAGPGLFATLASPAFTGVPTAPTASTSTNTTQIATTAFVKNQSYLTANQTITVSGDASGSGTTAITLTLATVATGGTFTKVVVNAKGLVTSGTTLSSSDVPKTLDHTWVTDFVSTVEALTLNQLTAPTTSLSLNSQLITNLATPVSSTDAATKAYVDTVAQGLNIKDSCVIATTANITLSGLLTIDGYTTVANDRVLVKNQTTASANGIYTAATGAWSRSLDFNSSSNAVSGSFVFVEKGTVGANTGWVMSTAPPITLGTTALTFTQFSGAGTYTASGNGITLTGTQFALAVVSGQIVVSGSGIGIDTGYVGQASITTLGTVTTGTIDGGSF